MLHDQNLLEMQPPYIEQTSAMNHEKEYKTEQCIPND